jgi:GntR family transcriptional regulator/MocR family aminotransferase
MKQLEISIDPQSQTSLGQQLYEIVRRQISDGAVKPGDKLTSSRSLAKQLGISRPTVELCYEQLIAEGYLEARHGSGTYVAEFSQVKQRGAKTRFPLTELARYLDKKLAAGKAPADAAEYEYPFFCWLPAVEQFPAALWSKILARHGKSLDAEAQGAAGHQAAAGMLPLRQAVAHMVKRFRDIDCSADQVVITFGLNQGLELAARLHLQAGQSAAIENPGYPQAAEIFQAYGAHLLHLDVDEEGLNFAAVRRQANKPSLFYLTPSHQFPTGAVMSFTRRTELLELANTLNAVIFEDDFDSEFRYKGRPIPALKSLDRQDRVIYAGTLNQVMLPSLGVGYLIVPEGLVGLYKQARYLAGAQLPGQMQLALAEFIGDGHLDKHVKKLRLVYAQRREALIDALEKYFGEKAEVSGDQAGVSLVVKFHTRKSDQRFCMEAARLGVGITPLSAFMSQGESQGAYLMGFANLEADQIEQGIKRLASLK